MWHSWREVPKIDIDIEDEFDGQRPASQQMQRYTVTLRWFCCLELSSAYLRFFIIQRQVCWNTQHGWETTGLATLKKFRPNVAVRMRERLTGRRAFLTLSSNGGGVRDDLFC